MVQLKRVAQFGRISARDGSAKASNPKLLKEIGLELSSLGGLHTTAPVICDGTRHEADIKISSPVDSPASIAGLIRWSGQYAELWLNVGDDGVVDRANSGLEVRIFEEKPARALEDLAAFRLSEVSVSCMALGCNTVLSCMALGCCRHLVTAWHLVAAATA